MNVGILKYAVTTAVEDGDPQEAFELAWVYAERAHGIEEHFTMRDFADDLIRHGNAAARAAKAAIDLVLKDCPVTNSRDGHYEDLRTLLEQDAIMQEQEERERAREAYAEYQIQRRIETNDWD